MVRTEEGGVFGSGWPLHNLTLIPVSHVLWTKKGPGNIFLLLLFQGHPGSGKRLCTKGKRYCIKLKCWILRVNLCFDGLIWTQQEPSDYKTTVLYCVWTCNMFRNTVILFLFKWNINLMSACEVETWVRNTVTDMK